MTNPNYRYDWYLLEAEAGQGMMLTAKQEIVARGVDFLLPMSWRRKLVEGQHRPVPEPRLPGRYAFVHLPSDPANPDILNAQAAAVIALHGVRDIFKNARGAYATVPKWEIQALKDADAEEHREAAKAKPKFAEAKFKKGTVVRVVRHALYEGQIMEFLYSVRGQATLAFDNGIKVSIPDCDITEAMAHRARLAG